MIRRRSLLSSVGGSAQPGGATPIRRPALRSYEGRRRGHQRSAAALGFAICRARPVRRPPVVETAGLGLARSYECREGAAGSCPTDSETRKFRKGVSARCGGQTRYARKVRTARLSRSRLNSRRSLLARSAKPASRRAAAVPTPNALPLSDNQGHQARRGRADRLRRRRAGRPSTVRTPGHRRPRRTRTPLNAQATGGPTSRPKRKCAAAARPRRRRPVITSSPKRSWRSVARGSRSDRRAACALRQATGNSPVGAGALALLAPRARC